LLSKIFIYSSLIVAIIFSGCSNRFKSSSNGLKSSDKMEPYQVNGKWFYPKRVMIGTKLEGLVSWYGDDYQGKVTASGETFNMYDPTAAHKTLPMNTMLYVKNLENRKSVIVRVNDRGPFIAGRELDVSKRAGQELGIIENGSANAEIYVIGYDGNIDQRALEKIKNSDTQEMRKHSQEVDRKAEVIESQNTKITPIVQSTFGGTEIIEQPIYSSKDGIQKSNEQNRTTSSIKSVEQNNTKPQKTNKNITAEVLEVVEPIDIDNNSSDSNFSQADEVVEEVANIVVQPQEMKSKLVRKYYVQVASFGNQDRAEIFAEKNSKILPENLSLEIRHERGLYRVWVAGFKDGNEAREFNNAKEYFPSSFLVYRDERE